MPAGKAVPIPPVRTFQHALKAWRVAYRNELRAIRDPDGFKAAVRFAAVATTPATRLNELWEIDASPADMLCVDGRHSLYLCIDVATRRLAALVSKTPRAAAVGLTLRKAILLWGVPETVRSDRGSDFIAHATLRLLASLGIAHDAVPPFSPERKPFVERAVRTVQHGLMRTLPGFVGHSVAERKVIEGRKAFARRLGETPEEMFEVSMTAAELQAALDAWCADVYAHKPHAGLKGKTPFAAAAMAPGPLRRIENIRALDLLLAAVAGKDGLRTATKTGLRIAHSHYLAGFLNVGDEVFCRMDEADMGRVHVFARDGVRFLGIAECPALLGTDPAAAIARAKVEQKRVIDDRFADAKRAARAIRPKDFAGAIRRQALKDAGTLVEFPKRAESHHTPQLAAAAAAATGHDAAPAHSAEMLALAAQLQAEQHGTAGSPPPCGDGSGVGVVKLHNEETPHHRFRRAQALEAALAEGRAVADADLLWLGGYREGPEYRGYAMTYGSATATESSASA